MGATLRVKFTTVSLATLTFDYDGEWRWDQPERVYRAAEEPPRLESIRHHWQLVGGAVLTPDGSTGGGWEAFRDLLDALNSGDDPIKTVTLVRVEAGVETPELTLGPPDFEGFLIERLSCDGPWQPAPRATHKIAFPIDLRMSARKLYARDLTLADGETVVTGVVGFEQTISHEYDASGLGVITAETTVTLVSGTGAEARAKLLGKLAIPGTTWSYDTNGPDGVDLTTIDADVSTNTTRLPRQFRTFSRVRQWGEPVGVTSPNTRPGTYSYEDARSDDGIEVTRVVSAEATGPGAESWVRSKAPASPHLEETVSKRTSRQFKATWTIRSPKGANAFTNFEVEITGGAEDFDYEPVNGSAAVLFEGPVLPFKLTVRVQVERRGGSGTKTELPLPPLLGDVWRLNRNASAEGQPKQEELVAQASNAKWIRNAVLVYESPVPPTVDPLEFLRANAANGVPSYYLPK